MMGELIRGHAHANALISEGAPLVCRLRSVRIFGSMRIALFWSRFG